MMKKADIYVGLNDMDTKVQKFELSRYTSVLKNVCLNYHVPFSFSVIEGGYFHENGEYTQENSLKISFIGIEQETVEEIAKDLCTFFRQKSVLITIDTVEVYSIHSAI